MKSQLSAKCLDFPKGLGKARVFFCGEHMKLMSAASRLTELGNELVLP